MKNLRITAGALAVTLAMMTGAGAAVAGAGVKVGTLICDVSGGIGLILGSKKSMRCTYSRASDGREEYYSGSISKFGLDIGVTTQQTMAWVVVAPGEVGAGALAGRYVGATAEATVAVGAGANVLVGGLDNTIALQPLSVQGQTGLNIAAGVADLRLDAN
jgi:hypothetical protein